MAFQWLSRWLVGAFELFWPQVGSDDRPRLRFEVRQSNRYSDIGQANRVYVIPLDRRLHIADHEISAPKFDEPRGQRAPIDLFFRSPASEHGDGFTVILTGAGSDGALGVRAVKETGGIILVQDSLTVQQTSRFAMTKRDSGQLLARFLCCTALRSKKSD